MTVNKLRASNVLLILMIVLFFVATGGLLFKTREEMGSLGRPISMLVERDWVYDFKCLLLQL